MAEDEQPLFGKRGEELEGEERVAICLRVHQMGQLNRTLRFAAQRIRNQLREILTAERRKHDVLYRRPRVSERLELAHERMGDTDFVVSIGADEYQVPNIWLGQQLFDEVQGGRVEPLQVVQKQRQRMFRAREGRDEAPENEPKAALRVLWRQFRDRRRLSDDELRFWNEVHDELVRSRPPRRCRVSRHAASSASLLPEERADQTLQGLPERRNTGCRACTGPPCPLRTARATGTSDLVQLVHYRGFADAGVAGDEHELRRPASHCLVEGRE